MNKRFNPLQWETTERALEWWDAQSSREQLMLVFIVVALACMLWFFASTAMGSSLKNAENSVAATKRDFNTVLLAQDEYRAKADLAKTFQEDLERHREFSLAGFVERTAREIGISESVGSINDRGIKPGERFDTQSVEVRFRKISLRATSELLFRIENAEQPLSASNVQIKTNSKDRNELDVMITITMLRPKAQQ